MRITRDIAELILKGSPTERLHKRMLWRRRFVSIGCTRLVVLIGPYAFKFPNFHYRWPHFLRGLLANIQEVAFAATKWPELCPIVFSLPGGWLIVARRARELTDEEFGYFDYDNFVKPAHGEYLIPAEAKSSSFGWLDGRIVCIDYGENS